MGCVLFIFVGGMGVDIEFVLRGEELWLLFFFFFGVIVQDRMWFPVDPIFLNFIIFSLRKKK